MLLRLAKQGRKKLSLITNFLHSVGCVAQESIAEREVKKMSSGGSEIEGPFIQFL